MVDTGLLPDSSYTKSVLPDGSLTMFSSLSAYFKDMVIRRESERSILDAAISTCELSKKQTLFSSRINEDYRRLCRTYYTCSLSASCFIQLDRMFFAATGAKKANRKLHICSLTRRADFYFYHWMKNDFQITKTRKLRVILADRVYLQKELFDYMLMLAPNRELMCCICDA